jgi:TMEM175 potassium channel family protein
VWLGHKATMAERDPTDHRVAVGLCATIGALLCLSWLVLFHVLSRRDDLTIDEVDPHFFAGERLRALGGALLYLAAVCPAPCSRRPSRS